MNNFISDCLLNLINEKVSIKLIHDGRIDIGDGMPSNGYFMDERYGTPEFAVAIGKPQEEWIGTFVHEYCHFEQWIDYKKHGSKEWSICIMDDKKDALDHVFEWIEYKRAMALQSAKHLVELQAACEWNCEKRVIKKIQKYDLDIDIQDYSRRANAYISFYFLIPILKSWYKTAPYESEEIMNLMPDEIVSMEDLKQIALKNVDLYRKEIL